MRISFHGAAETVTGSSHLVESGGLRVLIDCGMHQGGHEAEELNHSPWPFEPASLDYLILTHAHIDHSGLVPRLVKEGFRGRILTTPATIDLLGIMLADSAHIQEMESEWQSRKHQRAGLPPVEPLYTVADAERSLLQARPLAYGTPADLGHGVTVTLHDAGHILGSAIVELEAEGRRVVFSGDLGNRGTPIIRDPERLTAADVVVMESTYGDRLHPGNEDRVKELAEAISGTRAHGGNLIIPSFAVGRTQELLYDINLLLEARRISPGRFFIDSPLAISATEIFRRHRECFDDEARKLFAEGEDPFHFPGVEYTRTADQSKALNGLSGGVIIMSASGMCDAGRILHHLKHNLWRPEATILFVGFQAQGTLGRRILEGEKHVRIMGEDIAVKAHVVSIEAFSAHADQAGLLDWIGAFGQNGRRPSRVFLVHGEPAAISTLAGLVHDRLGYPVTVPQPHEGFEI
ncbi:MAG: MBL fold metallo-hydrolase RNA specificity domain-containing protein [Bacillota bacterium]